jgi:CspA family cold shock protein
MTTGTVKFFNEGKGYGFIAPDGGGNDAFVHITALERSGMRTLRENQRVSYDLQEDRRGKMAAVNLQSAEEATTSQDAAAQPESVSDEQAEEAWPDPSSAARTSSSSVRVPPRRTRTGNWQRSTMCASVANGPKRRGRHSPTALNAAS